MFHEHGKRVRAAASPHELKQLEDTFHQRVGGRYVGDFVFGANDGIITTFAVVAGASGAGLSSTVVIILGVANLIADGLSMGLGNFSGTKSKREYEAAQRHRELWEIENLPEAETNELRQVFAGWGFKGEDLERALRVVTSNKEAWLEIMMKHELGIVDIDEGSPYKHGLMTFVSFVAAGLVPLLPYLVPIHDNMFGASIVMGGVTLFTVGVLRSKVTSRHWIASGLESLAIGAVAAIVAYFVGDVLERLIQAFV